MAGYVKSPPKFDGESPHSLLELHKLGYTNHFQIHIILISLKKTCKVNLPSSGTQCSQEQLASSPSVQSGTRNQIREILFAQFIPPKWFDVDVGQNGRPRGPQMLV